MSIEKTIADLTAAINGLTAALGQTQGVPAAAPVAAPAPAPQATAMPAPPVFNAPAPAPAPFLAPTLLAPAGPVAPFTDSAGLINYVMGVYKEIGPAKGAQIQGVLTGLSYQNINDVKPEHYGALFAGVEALKG